jgi:single-strand DNA-binding protein
VSVRTYQTNAGGFRANLEVTADDVEFLSSRNENADAQPAQEEVKSQAPKGFQQVEMDDELPF